MRGVLATNDVAAVLDVTCRSAITCLVFLKDRDPSFSCVAFSFDRFQLIDLAVCAQGSENERRRSA